MTVLDFYKVISDDAILNILDDDVIYFNGASLHIPVKYFNLIIRQLTTSINPDTSIVEYFIWV